MSAGGGVSVTALALAAIRAQHAARGRAAESSLLDFIPHTTRDHRAPLHLSRYVALLERAWTEPVRAVISTPPRHFKSTTTLHWIVQTLKRFPTKRIGYATYAADFSEQQGKLAAFIAERAGLQLVEQRASFWRTKAGGRVDWTSIGGQLTGKGFDVLVVDDPVKGRAEAESGVIREGAWSWFNGDAFTRLEPGASVLVIQTRWHPDDLAGRLVAKEWPWINLPALDADGKALCPWRFDAAALGSIREQIGEYEWASLYQGTPRSKGGRVFGEAHFYDALPTSGYQISLGADFAYTSKTYADYSVAVVLLEHAGRFYVAEVVRQQTDAPTFRGSLSTLQTTWPGRVTAYVGGTEKGVVDFLVQAGVRIDALPAIVDKFARAQPAAAAWNAGKILLPRGAPWVDLFVSELAGFTGLRDRHDDQVDALAGAFAPFAVPETARGVGTEPVFPF